MNENENSKKELEKYRNEIDDVDSNIINLLNRRADIVLNIGEIKKRLKLDVYQPRREAEVIKKMQERSTILNPSSVEIIWKEIMGACKILQGNISKVGYLGPLGTFTHQAALGFFTKTDSELMDCKNVSEIFENIEKDILDFGVIAIENSLQGTVRDTLDLLIEKDLFIYGEIELRIIQNLISLDDSDLSKIEVIHSHPQALAQSKNWIKANIPKAKLVNTNSTAEAILKVKNLDNIKHAAIGTEFASQKYGLKIISSKIEDNPSNTTRFLIISKNENPLKEEKMKTSLIYVVKNVPGALYQVLRFFSEANINLLKIESRPRRKGKWEYIFLMDFEGDKDDSKIKKVLDLMSQNVIWYKILGSYPYL